MSGKLYGVGVGPGDPKLMTYLAVETIQNCPVIAGLLMEKNMQSVIKLHLEL